MATLTKTRGRKPLAQSRARFHGLYPLTAAASDDAQAVRVSVEGPDSQPAQWRGFNLIIPREEALALACYIAKVCNRRFDDHKLDVRHAPQALRDLADEIEIRRVADLGRVAT